MSPLRVFLLSLCAAALIAAGGKAYTSHIEAQLPEAIAECETESKRERENFETRRAANGGDSGPWGKFRIEGLVCDPGELYRARFEPNYKEPPGAQGKLVRAYDASLTGYEEGAYALAALCIFIGSLPGIWYFLLRRLSEIAAAIRGK